MVQFMREAYGKNVITQLLDRYARGETEAKAFPAVLGISREQFMSDFKNWATLQVASWGLAAEPSIDVLLGNTSQNNDGKKDDVKIDDMSPDAPIITMPKVEEPLTDEAFAKILAENPNHPDVLEIAARRAVSRCASMDALAVTGGIDDATAELLERYSKSRPLDPWPHQRLAARAMARSESATARDHLMFLDARADNDPSFALEVARIGRAAKEPKAALIAAERAARIDPYSAPTRELAASCALEAGELDAARIHIFALTMIEPDRAQHRRRLERIDELIAKRSASAQ
jgi:tetratricopeptide (TPR) repeat protein